VIPFEEYFWILKRLFPGDPEFSSSSYPHLCYGYVVRAIMMGQRNRELTLHETERPTALVASVIANQNRNPKKQKEAYTLDQFCVYKPREQQTIPEYMYGSAAVAAIKRGLLPAWALFCYKALAAAASDDYVPKVSIMVAEDALILHPTKTEDGYKGMLIAMESAGRQKREFTIEGGETVWLTVPEIETKVVAVEDVALS
tara:strand:- start:552 stop:1151 length:600 start_codon:yes stop_codon:yes gene_type:complete